MSTELKTVDERSNIAISWLEEYISKECNCRARIVKVAPLSDVLGMMSMLRRLTLECERKDGGCCPYSTMIIKMPSSSEAIKNIAAAGSTSSPEDFADMQQFMHNNETAVYTWLKSLPEQPIKHPKIFASFNLNTETPMILMEEVSGYLAKVEDGFTHEQLIAIVHELARFHAFCLTSNSWQEIDFYPMDFTKFAQFEKTMEQITAGLKERMPGFWDCIDPLFEKTTVTETWMLGRPGEDDPNRVVAHGDLWSPQIIWKDLKKGEIAGILDWQVAHLGSLIEDISRVLATCTTTDMRRSLQESLFDQYYQRLSEECTKRGSNVPFSRSFIDEEYKRLLPFTLSQTLFAGAIWANSNVLKKGDDGDERRIMEIFSRTRAFFEDSNRLLGWEK